MLLFIVRHAEAICNITKEYCSTSADTLTKNGREQAQNLAKNVSRWKCSKIISSPLQRATQTAERVADLQGLTVDVLFALKETTMCIGPYFEQNLMSDLVKCQPINRLYQQPQETYDQFLNRVSYAYSLIVKTIMNESYHTVLVGHNHLLSRLIETFLGVDTKGAYYQQLCGVTLLKISAKRCEIVFYNKYGGHLW